MQMTTGPDGSLYQISAQGDEAVRISAEIAKAHFKSKVILKLGLYAIAVFLVLASSFLIVFAPDGREGAAVFIGVALIIVGLGCAGFGSFSLKVPGIDLSAITLNNGMENTNFNGANQHQDNPPSR